MVLHVLESMLVVVDGLLFPFFVCVPLEDTSLCVIILCSIVKGHLQLVHVKVTGLLQPTNVEEYDFSLSLAYSQNIT